MDTLHHAPVRRKQLDRMLRAVKNLHGVTMPQKGWITEIRNILGMRSEQLSKRMGVAQSTLSQFEHSEANGTISINNLRRAAEAMDCQVVYVLVPRAGSFEDLVRARAQKVAAELVVEVNHTMALENQRTGKDEQSELMKELADKLVRSLSRDLWDDLD